MILLISIFSTLVGICITFLVTRKIYINNKKQLYLSSRTQAVLNQWLILQHLNMKLEDTIKAYKVNNLVIYGMGILGHHLVMELENSGIAIKYGMDCRDMASYRGIPVYKMAAEVETVGIVINTVMSDQLEIENMLKKHFECPIISLEDIVFESYRTSENENKSDS